MGIRYSIPAVKAHLLYLLYGNDMGSFSYTGKLWQLKLPIAIPYQQLIHTLLYLLYGNDMGSFSYTEKLCAAV